MANDPAHGHHHHGAHRHEHAAAAQAHEHEHEHHHGGARPHDQAPAVQPHHTDHAHHGHGHHGVSTGAAFAWSIGLNTTLVIVQVAVGVAAGSLALIADAGHNLSDIFGLVVAWIATIASRLRPTLRLTYGLRSTSIWAALFNAILVLLACGAIASEAIERLRAPESVNAPLVAWVALLGVVVNGASAWFFHRHAAHDLNARGAFLHLLADAGVSFAVVLAALGIMATGWHWLDPACSLAVVAVIVLASLRLLRQSLHLALGGVPAQIDPQAVRGFLASQPSITDVHDLHVWAMSTTEIALTVHLVAPSGHPGDDFLQQVTRELGTRFGIHHATIQIERGEHACALAPEHVV